MCVCVYGVYLCIFKYTHMHVYIFKKYLHVRLYMNVCVYVYVCVYIHSLFLT